MKYYISYGTHQFEANTALEISTRINELLGMRIVSVNMVYNAISRPGKSKRLKITRLSHRSPAVSPLSDPSHSHQSSSVPTA